MSFDCQCPVSFPHGAVGIGWSVVCNVIVTFPGHTHLLFNVIFLNANSTLQVPSTGLCCKLSE